MRFLPRYYDRQYGNHGGNDDRDPGRNPPEPYERRIVQVKQREDGNVYSCHKDLQRDLLPRQHPPAVGRPSARVQCVPRCVQHGPSGTLIARFGVERITGIGLSLIVLAAIAGITGITVAHFWTALVLLGLGWNLAFIGATTMVTQCYRPEERNKVQAFNDFLIFGGMALSSFSSGQLLADFGWPVLNAVIFPTVVIAGALLVWHSLRGRAEAAAEV